VRTSLFQTEKSDQPFVVLATLVFIVALVVTAWDFIVVQKMIYRFEMMNFVGLLLFVLGVVIRLVGRLTLGKYYSYGLRTLPNHKLVKHGIYKYIRHPISLAAIIYSAGIPLFFSSLYGFLIMLGLVPLILYRIRIEEKMLIEKLGDEYRVYMKRTKKLIPFIY
jgi:protein-S-isoprenylcysteine O-methyltransferase Ste14